MQTHLLGAAQSIGFALQWFANIFAFPVKRLTPPPHSSTFLKRKTVKWAYKIKYVERFVCQLVARLFDSVSVLFATFFACIIYKKMCRHCSRLWLYVCVCVWLFVLYFAFCAYFPFMFCGNIWDIQFAFVTCFFLCLLFPLTLSFPLILILTLCSVPSLPFPSRPLTMTIVCTWKWLKWFIHRHLNCKCFTRCKECFNENIIKIAKFI